MVGHRVQVVRTSLATRHHQAACHQHDMLVETCHEGTSVHKLRPLHSCAANASSAMQGEPQHSKLKRLFSWPLDESSGACGQGSTLQLQG